MISISATGLLLSLESEELFLPFKEFPWFETASVNKVFKVESPSEGHLYWPELDVDLDVDSIRHPSRYPLVSKTASGGRPAAVTSDE